MARLRLPGFNVSNRRKANWVLGSVEFSPEAARWSGSGFHGLRSQEKMEGIEKFSLWLVPTFCRNNHGHRCRIARAKGGSFLPTIRQQTELSRHRRQTRQTRSRGLRNIKNSPGRFGAWSIRIVTVESEEDPRLYNSQAL